MCCSTVRPRLAKWAVGLKCIDYSALALFMLSITTDWGGGCGGCFAGETVRCVVRGGGGAGAHLHHDCEGGLRALEQRREAADMVAPEVHSPLVADVVWGVNDRPGGLVVYLPPALFGG